MLESAISLTFGLLTVAWVLNLYRLVIGPSLPDRVLALDTMYINSIALIVVYGIQVDSKLYFEAAMLIALIGFVSTVAVAKYIRKHPTSPNTKKRPSKREDVSSDDEDEDDEDEDSDDEDDGESEEDSAPLPKRVRSSESCTNGAAARGSAGKAAEAQEPLGQPVQGGARTCGQHILPLG